jgi:integrase
MRGNIRKRGANSWELQIELDRVGGKRRRRFVSVKGTYKDAQRELTKLLAAADEGTLADATRATVGAYIRQWLDNTRAQSPKTLERYRELAEHQIVPHLGDIKMQKLTPEHIETWHTALLAKGLATRTVGHAHSVLRLALKRAVENGSLARNVAAIRKPPAVETKEVEILTSTQVKTLLDGLQGHMLHPIAALDLATGLRRGELLALQWGDIDLDRGIMRVERSVEETNSGLRLKPPKTRRGRRNIGLSRDAVELLRRHRKEQLELRLQLGQGGQPVLVFGNIDGELLSPDNLSREWRRICRIRKLPYVSFHALRHTHASALIAAGVDILTISRRLRHSKASMTLDVYGHLIEGGDAAAAQAIEGMLR